MARCRDGGIEFEDEREQYRLYNFQDPARVARLRDALLGKIPGFERIIELSGPSGAGQCYLIHAAAHAATEAGSPTRAVRLDTLDYEPDRTTPAEYVGRLLERHPRAADQGLREVAEGALSALGSATLSGSVAAGLAILLSPHLSSPALLKLFQTHWREGPKRDPEVALHRLLEGICADHALVLILPEGTTLPLHDSLLEALGPIPGLTLAFPRLRPGAAAAYRGRAPLPLDVPLIARDEMSKRLTAVLGEHRLPKTFADELWQATGGLPGQVAITICDLKQANVLYRDLDEQWVLPPEGMEHPQLVESLKEGLYRPLRQLVDRLWKENQGADATRLKRFLGVCALCGEYVPIEHVAAYLDCSPEERERLFDLVDDELGEALGEPLFTDLGRRHEGFPNLELRAFRDRLMPAVLLAMGVLEAPAREAAQFGNFLEKHLPTSTRAIARLRLQLLEHGGERGHREFLESELAWWVGLEEAEALERSLSTKLEEGRLDREVLLRLVEMNKTRWPPQCCLALLQAYATSSVPETRLGEWHSQRGWVFSVLGDHDAARADREHALAIFESKLGKQHPQLCFPLIHLGTSLINLDEHTSAHTLLTRALAINEETDEPDLRVTAFISRHLGRILFSQNKVAAARPHIEKALAIFEQLLDPNHREVAITLEILGQLQFNLGELNEARSTLEQALAIHKRSSGANQINTATTLSILSVVLNALGDPSKARRILEQVLAMLKAVRGTESSSVADASTNLGKLLRALGEPEKARPILEQAVTIEGGIYGPGHPETVRPLIVLGGVLRDLGNPEQALTLTEQGLSILEAAPDATPLNTGTTLRGVGAALRDLGETKRARSTLERALTIHEESLRPGHPAIGHTLRTLGTTLHALGETTQARTTLERALEILEGYHGPHHYKVAITLSELAPVVSDLGEPETARGQLERALKILRDTFGEGHPRTREVMEKLGLSATTPSRGSGP